MGCAYINGDICDNCGQASLHPAHLDQRRAVRRADRDGYMTLVQRLLLYDFLEERDGQLVLPLDFVELLDLYSDEEEEPSDEGDNN